MAQNKKSFIAYCDWLELFEEMEDDEAGRLWKHLLRYVNDLNPEAPDKLTKLSFITLKQTLKRDLAKHQAVAERNKVNGSKGGRPKKPTGLSGLKEKPKKADSDNDSVSDNEKKQKGDKSPSIDFDFDEYLRQINKIFGKNHQVVSKKLKQKVNARLKQGYTKDNFWIAIQNVKKNEYHIDNNFQYVDPFFFAQEEKIAKYGDKLRDSDSGSNTYQLID